MDKLSYALGLSLGQELVRSGVERVEFNDLIDGVKTIYLNRKSKLDPEEGNKILNDYFTKVGEKREEAVNKERESNLKSADEYLNQNRVQDGVIETKSGLQYKVITGVTGENPTAHSRVRVHYEGRLIDGRIFDSSYMRKEPVDFGLDQVIPGWTEGLQLMTPGSKYEFTIPPQLGYGEVGVPGHIPGNSVLIFTVELLEILQ